MSVQSPEQDSFKALQYQFAGHIRNPEQHQIIEGIEERRMKIYRDLFFNNVDGFLSNNFPVFKTLCAEQYWQDLVRDFLTKHHCHTPLFLEIGQEFMNYVAEHRQQCKDDLPFMQELLHYEWVELALDSAETENPSEGIDRFGNLLDGHPVQSPLAWSLSYHYPVHQIRPAFQPDSPGEVPTFLIVYRNSYDEVKFMETNGLTARLLYLLSENESMSGRQALQAIAQELPQLSEQQVIDGGRETLENLRKKGILLGTTQV